MRTDIDSIRQHHMNELLAYLDRIWPAFLVACRVKDRQTKAGRGKVTMEWSPPLPHPVGSRDLDLLLEPLIKARMEKAGFLGVSVMGLSFLNLFWEKGSVPAK